jgi:hypothetical protein
MQTKGYDIAILKLSVPLSSSGMDKLDKIRLGDDEKSITVNYFLFHSIS